MGLQVPTTPTAEDLIMTAEEFREEADKLLSDFYSGRVDKLFSIRPDITTGLTDYFSGVRKTPVGEIIETNEGISAPLAEVRAFYDAVNMVINGSVVNYSTASLEDPIFFASQVGSEIRVQLLEGGIVYSIGLERLQSALGIYTGDPAVR